MTAYHARVTAIGSYVPNQIMTNHDLEKLVETNDEWIVQRTGIKERRIAGQTESTSDLAYQAAMNLKQRYNTEFQDVDMIIICTMTPDFKTPSTASLVQAKLGINHAGVIDLNAACAGFTYGLHLANGLISSGLHKKFSSSEQRHSLTSLTMPIETHAFYLEMVVERFLWNAMKSSLTLFHST